MSTGGESGPGGLDRRRAERVLMTTRGGRVSVVGARLVNVSSYGMMIESPVPLEGDAILQLRLVVDGRKTDVQARVAACTTIAGGRRRRFGVGLEFTEIPPETRERLNQVLSRPEPASA